MSEGAETSICTLTYLFVCFQVLSTACRQDAGLRPFRWLTATNQQLRKRKWNGKTANRKIKEENRSRKKKKIDQGRKRKTNTPNFKYLIPTSHTQHNSSEHIRYTNIFWGECFIFLWLFSCMCVILISHNLCFCCTEVILINCFKAIHVVIKQCVCKWMTESCLDREIHSGHFRLDSRIEPERQFHLFSGTVH